MDDKCIARWLGRVVETDEGCWLWPGAKFRSGYANVGTVERGQRRNRSLHRVFYERFVGPIPEGLDLDHLCRTTSCVNPGHVEPVTRSVNLRRGNAGGLRNRGRAAANAAKTHCHHGHPFDEENTHWTKAGGRSCRACDRDRHRHRYRERAVA